MAKTQNQLDSQAINAPDINACDINSLDIDTLWYNARIATMVGDSGQPYGLLENAAIAIKGETILWVGDWDGDRYLLADLLADPSIECLDCDGRLVTPGLIDCHTHIVYAGNRANEFEMRLNGASYQDIAKAGGGIVATVRATRAASEEQLLAASTPRLQAFMDEGVTTIEIKSGYGLSLVDEVKMLRVARRLGEQFPVNVVTSFLGAHTLPPEAEADSYLELVCNAMLDAVVAENLAYAVDGFCENIAFSNAQMAQVFAAAGAHNLPIKLHAEQFTDQKGALMAAGLGALSVDHLEYLDPQDAAALAQHGTVAVLLPGAFYCLRETQLPPIQALRDASVAIAIASDSNPGSSPAQSLLLMLNMACNLFRLTPEEALCGVTRNAAKALGRADTIGTLERGKQADLVLWNLRDPAELSYRLGGNPCATVMVQGKLR